jgi:hypothetical protein
VKLQNLDTSLTHVKNKVCMIPLRLFDPEHVIKQEVVTIARREPLVRHARTTDHH